MRALWILTIAVPTGAAAQWTNSVSKDPMTNEQMVGAVSSHTTPSREMDFPYKDTEAWMAYVCSGKTEWVYFEFSNAPNIVDADPTADGFSHFRTRVRWGTEVKTVQMSQKWGESVISFTDGGGDALKRLVKSTAADSLLLELNWYGNGSVYFSFSLAGATEAIGKAKASCKQ